MDPLQNLKNIVIKASGNPSFIHHTWYITYHILIVEKISLELCERHPEANKDIVQAMVWMHDYGKMLGLDTQSEESFTKVGEVMLSVAYEQEFCDQTLEYLRLMEKKNEIDLHIAPIEVKIVSSADGASHMVGPFHSLFWYENSGKMIDEIMSSNKRKSIKDWDRKIVLPEVREAFQSRNQFVLEQNGDIPEKFLL